MTKKNDFIDAAAKRAIKAAARDVFEAAIMDEVVQLADKTARNWVKENQTVFEADIKERLATQANQMLKKVRIDLRPSIEYY